MGRRLCSTTTSRCGPRTATVCARVCTLVAWASVRGTCSPTRCCPAVKRMCAISCSGAPDGSTVRAFYLAEGYFAAGGLDADDDVAATVARLKPVVDRLLGDGTGPVLLMNGFDHLPP